MSNNNPNRTNNNIHRNRKASSRDPFRQNFDKLDAYNDFTNLRIINRYREIGDAMMARNFWK